MFICVFCGKEFNKNASMLNHSHRCPSNPDRKIQSGRKGKKPWNVGMTKRDDERIARPQFVGRKFGRSITGQPEEYRRKLSVMAKERHLGGHTSKKKLYFQKKNGDVIYLQSSYEIRFAEILEELGIEWTRPSPLLWVDENKVEHRYYPDFLIGNIYVDTKNDYLIKKDEKKVAQVRQQNNVEVRIVSEREITKEYIAGLVSVV